MAILSGAGRYSHFGILLMRLGLGAMMMLHGFPKLQGGPEKWQKIGGSMQHVGITVAPVFWGFMAGVGETLGGLLLILGLWFRPATLLLLITMCVAATHHLSTGDTLMGASHPIELAVVFLGLFFIGPGRLSIDKK